jgi:hypothetical protein
MNMVDRLEYTRYIASKRLGPLQSSDQFGAVEGMFKFAIRKNLGAKGTWFSYANAGAVEAIERGAAIALGLSKQTGGNPAALKWAAFFTLRKVGKLTERAVSLYFVASHRRYRSISAKGYFANFLT